MRKLFLLVLAAAILGGCRSHQSPPSALSLNLAVNDIYCKDTACACVHHVAARTYTETQAVLKEQYGIDLQLDYYVEPYNLETAILSGDYDGALCKPWTVLMLEKKAGADFERVVDILDPNNNRWLSGSVAVMADSGFKTLEDLRGKSVVIGDADAYEKHQAAKRLFKQKKVTFQRMETMASCIENLGMLMDGEVDAAVVSDYALTADCAVDFANPEDFRILGKTENIPLTSIIVDARKVPETDRVRLQAALLAISAEGAPESLLSKGFVEPAVWNPVELEK
ncbi:MAG: PhnD/SsuA/transferrin family substrate-binding protein [Kiritimatiellaceae bacterium]|nr:PhnD/SsuA/transferrin family substrate-binding protein [Kiritimatiellaceae bacterium]